MFVCQKIALNKHNQHIHHFILPLNENEFIALHITPILPSILLEKSG